MTDATELDVAAARARCDAATEGPWRAAEQSDREWWGIQSEHVALASVFDRPNAEFIAAARTALPAALDEITRLQAALDEARAEVARAKSALDRVRRRHPRGDEEGGVLAPGLWCPTCGRERSENGYGACPDRAALATPTTTESGAQS